MAVVLFPDAGLPGGKWTCKFLMQAGPGAVCFRTGAEAPPESKVPFLSGAAEAFRARPVDKERLLLSPAEVEMSFPLGVSVTSFEMRLLVPDGIPKACDDTAVLQPFH